MDYKEIIYKPGKVARVILNRESYLNAQSWLLREEMDDAFDRAVADYDVGVVRIYSSCLKSLTIVRSTIKCSKHYGSNDSIIPDFVLRNGSAP